MPRTEVGALERGREAYEDRAWAIAFDELAGADAADSLAAEDLERLGEAARWSRHFDRDARHLRAGRGRLRERRATVDRRRGWRSS